MLFNSLEFAIFLPLVFALYWFVAGNNVRYQNAILLISSFIFYGWWDWRFLLLLIFSAGIDFFVGIGLGTFKTEGSRKWLLLASIFVNLGLLSFFKYYNFFAQNFIKAFSFFGQPANLWTLKVILPVGISFYTFQAISYVVDVYKNRLEPTRSLITYFTYISFFPQLVAGPIERAPHMLPQFTVKRTFSYAEGVDGIRLMMWGLFKKVVVADNCALFVNSVFADYQLASSGQLILGLIFFAFQIYCDFSGYSDIALGTGRLFGFRLMTNFRTPYFARDIAEFWRRWHISLTTWFRDYVYIPLGGSKGPKGKVVANTFIIFLLSGFWHGSNWTFIFWGLVNAILFLPLLLAGKNRSNTGNIAEGKILPTFKELVQMIATFLSVCLCWLFFRSPDIATAFDYLFHILRPGQGVTINAVGVGLLTMLVAALILFEWIFREDLVPFSRFSNQPVLRYVSYSFILFLIVFYGAFVNPQSFIYFQF